MKSAIAKINPPGISTLSPNSKGYLYRGWLSTGTYVLILGPGSTAEYTKVMSNNQVFEIYHKSYSCTLENDDVLDDIESPAKEQ